MQAQGTPRPMYRGLDRKGAGIMGTAREGESPGDLAERLFKRGVRRATIEVDGRVAGKIEVVDGKRIWWGER